jgi:hypothetical protein
LAYAESHDGLNWSKPDLGIVGYNGSKANNLLDVPSHEGAVFEDPVGEPDARYVYVTHIFGEGLVRFFSPDGLRWQRDRKPLLNFCCDTQTVVFRDPQQDTYALYTRGWDMTRGWNERLRQVVRLALPTLSVPANIQSSGRGRDAARPDHLPKIVDEIPTVFAADEQDPRDTDVYNIAALPYPLDSRWYLGFPSFYRHAPGGFAANDGRLEVHCIGSRDGITWRRYDRKAYAPPGLAASHSANMVFMGAGMITRGDEIWQYGATFRTTHGQPKKRREEGDGVICRYVQRLDGFVSLDFANEEAWATTAPADVDGPNLFANVDTGALGELRVGLLDEAGAAIEGFTTGQCDPLHLNSTRASVTWRGDGDLSRLAGESVRFDLRGVRTKLYALYFGDAGKDRP